MQLLLFPYYFFQRIIIFRPVFVQSVVAFFAVIHDKDAGSSVADGHCGTVKMFKYTPPYANGKEPVIEEQDVYRTENTIHCDFTGYRG